MNYQSFTDYINKEFPSKYLKAEDLQGKATKAKISRIVPETVHNPERNQKASRLIAYFEGRDKGVILSKGRTDDLVKMYGENIQSSIGKEVVLMSTFDRGKKSIRFNTNGHQKEEFPDIQVDADEDFDVNNIPL